MKQQMSTKRTDAFTEKDSHAGLGNDNPVWNIEKVQVCFRPEGTEPGIQQLWEHLRSGISLSVGCGERCCVVPAHMQHGEVVSPLQQVFSINTQSYGVLQQWIRSNRKQGSEFWRGRSRSLKTNLRTLIGNWLINFVIQDEWEKSRLELCTAILLNRMGQIL